MNLDNIESSKIESIIPRQLIADAGGLIQFLKEYYNFLNEEGGPSHVLNNILANRDLDRVVDEFLELLQKEVGAGFTTQLVANKVNLYKNIVQFYQSKGSIESFKLLFRLLYNIDVNISFPKEKILIASDGRWLQQNSIFIEATEGDAFDLYASVIQLTTTERIVTVEVERIKRIGLTNYYEIFITKDINTPFINVGATINALGVVASVIPSLNKYEVVYPGEGFNIAQFVDVVEGTGTGVKIKTSVIGPNGELEQVKMLSFGIDYSDEFYAEIIPSVDVVGGVDFIISTDPEADHLANPTRAILKFSNSPVAQYPGEYITNNGFLSDDIYLQDNYFYQQFSYLITSSQQFDNYKNIVDKTVHPAGMIMFGEFEINNEFDLSRNLDALRRYFTNRISDSVDTFDAKKITFYKLVNDFISTSDNDFYSLNKVINDTITTLDIRALEVYKLLNDTVTTNDVITIEVLRAKTINDIVNGNDIAIITLSKQLNDDINTNDTGVIEILNSIYAEDYFAEDYSEGVTSFT